MIKFRTSWIWGQCAVHPNIDYRPPIWRVCINNPFLLKSVDGLSFRMSFSDQPWWSSYSFLSHGALVGTKGAPAWVLSQHTGRRNDDFFLKINLHEWPLHTEVGKKHISHPNKGPSRNLLGRSTFLNCNIQKIPLSAKNLSHSWQSPTKTPTATVSPVTMAQTATKKMADQSLSCGTKKGTVSVP